MRYPVKGLRGEVLQGVDLAGHGPFHDRTAVLIDPDGHVVTQRDCAAMALVLVRADASGLLFPEFSKVCVAWPEGPADVQGHLWGGTYGLRLGPDWISNALSQKLGRAVRLAFQADLAEGRAVYGEIDSPVSLADELPLLIATEASLAALNVELPEAVPMNRFRPNIVIGGTEAWAEDRWLKIRIGACVLRVVQPCKRCVVTTIDQATAARPDKSEPLRTLARLRRHTGAATFGVQAVVEQGGAISFGDEASFTTG